MARHLSALAVIAFAAAASPAMATTYNFTPLSGTSFGAGVLGAPGSPATVTINGATFSTTATGGYSFGPNAGNFSLLGATVLAEDDATFTQPLTITFGTPVTTGLRFDFATQDLFGGTDTLGVSVNGATAVNYNATTPGTDFYPEGTVALTNASISSIRLTNTNGIVIADLASGATSVPEPASLTLLTAGLLGLVGSRLRRRA